jgi:hypothetical protein
MDQQIQEAGVEEVVYLTDDQKGYNLRSKSAGPKTPIAAPVKNPSKKQRGCCQSASSS